MSASQSASAPASPTGRVINIADARDRDATGNFVTGKNVTYQLATGQTATVFVPGATFSEDAVRAAVTADAATLAKVANLTF
jgi:hypothetical protein